MNAYIWDRVEAVNNSYHDSGGVLICAETLEEALTLMPFASDHMRAGDTRTEPIDPPDYVLPLMPGAPIPTERVLVFPDAGCC